MLTGKKILSALAGLAMLTLPTAALAGHHHDGDDSRPYAWHDHGWHRGWDRHHDDWRRDEWRHFDHPAENHNLVCDADGDDCRPAYGYEGYGWRHPANPYYGTGYYGAPITPYAGPANAANPQNYRSRLLQRRAQTVAMINRMRARGDSRAAARLADQLNRIDASLRTVNRRNGAFAPASAYVPPVTSYQPGYNWFGQSAYAPAYNPNPIGNIVGSFLGMP
jgi:hypothetical protein